MKVVSFGGVGLDNLDELSRSHFEIVQLIHEFCEVLGHECWESLNFRYGSAEEPSNYLLLDATDIFDNVVNKNDNFLFSDQLFVFTPILHQPSYLFLFVLPTCELDYSTDNGVGQSNIIGHVLSQSINTFLKLSKPRIVELFDTLPDEPAKSAREGIPSMNLLGDRLNHFQDIPRLSAGLNSDFLRAVGAEQDQPLNLEVEQLR